MTDPAVLKARFLKKVDKRPSGCWLWRGHVNKVSGYGQFWDGERVRGAHQVSYELFKGPIPKGHEPDHTCRVRRCVCPDHLEAVTHRVNLLRGVGFAAKRAAQTDCKDGHPLSGDNLYVAKNGTRQCRKCRALLYRRWVGQNRARRREIDRTHYRSKKVVKQKRRRKA